MSTLQHDATRRCENRPEAWRLHFTGVMSDPATARIPRDELLGLLSTSSDVEEERTTTPMSVVRLDELLAAELIAPDAEVCLDDCLEEILAPAHIPHGSVPAFLVDPRPAVFDASSIDLIGSRHVTITIATVATLVLGILVLVLF